jgi:benzoylformate decarboxylase
VPIVAGGCVSPHFVSLPQIWFLSSEFALHHGGALGWGMPAAIGASLGLGRSPVVSLVGDGAALHSPQALWTAVHKSLPVTFVVMINREYNILKRFIRSNSGHIAARTNHFIVTYLDQTAIDYLALAKSIGLPAQWIEKRWISRPPLQPESPRNSST